jgi:hypothetical protein
MADKTEWIIVWTVGKTRYVHTKRGRWCHHYAVANEGLWMKFGSKAQAEGHLAQMDEDLPGELGQIKVEEWRS